MSIFHRHFLTRLLLGTLTVFVIAACSDVDGKNATSDRAIAPGTSSPAAYRAIEHALGTTQVPIEPKRVVVLGNTPLDATLALGIEPVGVAAWGGVKSISGVQHLFKDKKIEGIEYLGQESQPNLEKILVLKPDLILGNGRTHKEIYDQLSKIAPTVLCEWSDTWTPMTWKEDFKCYAEALDKTDEAEQIVSNYNQRVAQFKQQMGNRLSRTQVSVVHFEPGEVRLYMNDSYIGSILQDLGLPRPPAQNQDKWSELISLERLANADGDVIFVTRLGSQGTPYQKFTSNPLWQQLGAVRSDQVYEVDYQYWIGGSGPIASNLILDDLFRYLVEDFS